MIQLINARRIASNLRCSLLVLCCLLPHAARAGCELFVPTAINSVGIDGTVSSPNEWADANVIRSGEGCFTAFFDRPYPPPPSMTQTSSVTVYAKQNASQIFLRFVVNDATGNPPQRTSPPPDSPVLVKDYIYIVVGPNPGTARNTGTTGANMIKIINPRAAGAWSPSSGTALLNTGNGTGWSGWTALPIGGTNGYSVAITNQPSRYEMEVAIPKPSPGSDAHNLGFAVINDVGTADSVQTGYLDAFASNFPSGLSTTAIGMPPTNPADPRPTDPEDPIPTGSTAWVQQQNWALTASQVGAQVTISHNPQYGWLSDDIDVLGCDEDPMQLTPRVGDSYLYIETLAIPCRMRVRVWLRNTGATTQYRSILAVASTSGMGVSDWQVVGLGENVAVPPTGMPTSPAARVWHSGLVTPLPGMINGAHPCVRVYVLPAQLDAQTRAQLQTNAQVNDAYLHGAQGLVARFGLDSSLGGTGSQVAQQNISVASMGTCPVCRIAGAPDDDARFAATTTSAPSRPATVPGVRLAAAGSAAMAAAVAATQDMSVRDRLRQNYGQDHVAIDVRGFAFDTAPAVPPPAYRIIEPIGGVTQLFKPKRSDSPASTPTLDFLPVHFVVGNQTNRTRTFIVQAEIEYPPGYGQGLPKRIELPPFVLGPGETRLIERLPLRSSSAPKIALIAGLGASLPNGSFGNNYDGGLSVSIGLEYIFSSSWSLEATLSGHRFRGQGAARDVDITQFGLNAKAYLSAAPLRWFTTAGVASYRFDPGQSRTGVNAGLGLQYEITPQWSLEGRYSLHSVSGNASNSLFATATVGLRLAF